MSGLKISKHLTGQWQPARDIAEKCGMPTKIVSGKLKSISRTRRGPFSSIQMRQVYLDSKRKNRLEFKLDGKGDRG
jgi:hypothetical protein